MSYEYGYIYLQKRNRDMYGVQVDRTQSSKDPLIHLPHSCDEWVIGEPDDAKALIADLYRAIDVYNEKKENNDDVS